MLLYVLNGIALAYLVGYGSSCHSMREIYGHHFYVKGCDTLSRRVGIIMPFCSLSF